MPAAKVRALKRAPRRSDSDVERDDAGYVPRTRSGEASPRAGSSAKRVERGCRGACSRDPPALYSARACLGGAERACQAQAGAGGFVSAKSAE